MNRDHSIELRDWTRRRFLSATASVMVTAGAAWPVMADDEPRPLADIESALGGRVGVFAIDTGSDRQLAHRADERFAMCSTFKWVLAAAVLSRAERGKLSLDERVPYGKADLLEYAPTTTRQAAEGFMTVGSLAEAALTVSDNTAANLLLAKLGGPAGLTEFARSLGDTVTRLDRNEPGLNENKAGDPRDTTSPRAMAGLMRKILCGDALSPAGRERLLGWLRACETGKDRLRAGLPRDWVAGDKTGSGQRGAVNDIAIATPPGRAPILIAAYLSDAESKFQASVAAHAEIGRLVARSFK